MLIELSARASIEVNMPEPIIFSSFVAISFNISTALSSFSFDVPYSTPTVISIFLFLHLETFVIASFAIVLLGTLTTKLSKVLIEVERRLIFSTYPSILSNLI